MQIIKNDYETYRWKNSKKDLLYLLYSIYIENESYSIKWYIPIISIYFTLKWHCELNHYFKSLISH